MKHKLYPENTTRKKDLICLLAISFLFAGLYIAFEEPIMEYAKNPEHNLFLRFVPVLVIQFGMSVLGPLVIIVKNQETFSDYDLVPKNSLKSIGISLIYAVPTLLFLRYYKQLHSFLPFQGMFLTKEILNSPFPLNLAGYLLIALIWGFGEGLCYIVLSRLINDCIPSTNIWNTGAFVCALFAILIHGMFPVNMQTSLEALATFILMYGSLCAKDRLHNAWGIIFIFFAVWNAW